jgi:hypothetical protein
MREIVDTLQSFDRYLAERDLHFKAVVIGGAALNLLGVISRFTKDCDILYPEIPPEIEVAARSFAQGAQFKGQILQEDWLNNGPASLIGQLNPGWQERLQTIFVGRAITLSCLGRKDLLASKLFALCDRGTDLGDCLALAPTRNELNELLPWLEQQDANPDWPAHVRATIEDLEGRLPDGI